MNDLPRIKENYPAPVPEEYLSNATPKLDLAKLEMELLSGDERAEKLKTPTPSLSNATLALFYKGKEGAVLSFLLHEQDLRILQLQNARSRKSYRVTHGMDVVGAFANQVHNLAVSNELSRISMPSISQIEGIGDVNELAIESVVGSYKDLISSLLMSWSNEENLFTKDLK